MHHKDLVDHLSVIFSLNRNMLSLRSVCECCTGWWYVKNESACILIKVYHAYKVCIVLEYKTADGQLEAQKSR